MSHTTAHPEYRDNGAGRCFDCGKTAEEHQKPKEETRSEEIPWEVLENALWRAQNTDQLQGVHLVRGEWSFAASGPFFAAQKDCLAIVHPDGTIEYLHRNLDGTIHHITTES